MFNSIYGFILNFKLNSFFGFILYWIPFLFCLFGYTLRTYKNFRQDIVDRKKDESESEENRNKYCYTSYSPTDTIGSLIGRFIVLILPIVNIWAAMFDLALGIFHNFFKIIRSIFNQPLVPKRKR